jgi:hypothetical protein
MAKERKLKERQHIGWRKVSEKKLTIDNIRTIKECELYVDWLWWRVHDLHGEEEAKRIFAEFGKPPTKRAVKLNDDARLLLKYLDLFIDIEGTPSVREYAVRVAKEKRADPDAMERKVWRVLNDERIWDKLYDEGYLSCPRMSPEELAELKADLSRYS